MCIASDDSVLRSVWNEQMMEKKTRARLYFYVEVKLIDGKTKYYKDRRGLEQEEVEALLFEWTPWDIASIALVF